MDSKRRVRLLLSCLCFVFVSAFGPAPAEEVVNWAGVEDCSYAGDACYNATGHSCWNWCGPNSEAGFVCGGESAFAVECCY